MKRRIISILIILVSSLIGFSQDTTYKIYALRFTSPSKPFPVSRQILDAPDSIMASGVYMFWLIKGDNGKNILVDAGFLNDIEEAKSRGITNYVRPDSMLLRLGLKAESITDVIITHPHWDHLDGVDLFPSAHIWIQKEDFYYFVGNAWQKDFNRSGFNKRDVRKLLELNLEGRLTLIDGDDQEILSNIKVYTGSRHTFNSQYVLIKSGEDKIIIASDNVKLYYNLDHMKSLTLSGTGTFDTTAYVKAMERMKTLASNIKFIIPGHDALLFSKFPSITDGIIKIK